MSIPRQESSSNGDRKGGDRAGGRPAARLPFVVALDDSDTPYDVVDALALAPFTKGDQPWARSARIDRLKPGANLLPVNAEVVRTVVEDARDSRLATGDGWTVRAVRWRGGSAEVLVTAVSEELARTVLDGVVREAAADSGGEGSVTMGFWYLSNQRGPTRITRRAVTTSWPSIRDNYAAATLDSLDRLMTTRPDSLVGRLILLHGPAGTGKTTVLRALAHEWRRWCQVDCVLDPEALFTDPGYLMEVAIGSDDPDDDGQPEESGLTGDGAAGEREGTAGETDDTPRRRWRLLVIEDCDELVRGDARSVSGQALSRLLNLTDGLVGQGREVLVALTTNEPLARLHPAIVRPGRCLAQVEVGPLPYDEAVKWLGATAGVGASMTLAELFALRDGRMPSTSPDRDGHTGLYL